MTTPDFVNEIPQTPQTNATESVETDVSGTSQRERSTIRFPYTDIRDAVLVASKLKESYGSECETDQLAAALGQKPSSGAFRTKIATAAIFGVIDSKRGAITLTRPRPQDQR